MQNQTSATFLKQIEQVSSNNEAKELLDGNILIDANLDPQQLILTTLLSELIQQRFRGGYAGKPVVVPYLTT